MTREDAGTWMPEPEDPDEESGNTRPEPGSPEDHEDRISDLEDEVERLDRRQDAHADDMTSLLKEVQDIRKGLPWATLAVCVVQVLLKFIEKM